MNDRTQLVKGTDFVMVPTRDFDAAVEFFDTVLGLPLAKRYGEHPGGELETGNLTLSLMQSDAFGLEFTPNRNPIALRVDDVDVARAELESHGVDFVAQFDSGCVIRPSFTTRMETRSCCTTAMHRTRPRRSPTADHRVRAGAERGPRSACRDRPASAQRASQLAPV